MMTEPSYIGYESKPQSDAGSVTKIGGMPTGFAFAQWPFCGVCRERQLFLLQLDLHSPLKLAKKYRWAYVFACSNVDCEPFLDDSGANAVILVDEANSFCRESNLDTGDINESLAERHLTFAPYSDCEDDLLGDPELYVGIAPDYHWPLVAPCLRCRGDMNVIAQFEYGGRASYINLCQAECCGTAASFMW